MKELKNEMLKIIVEVEGVENLLNKHLTQLYKQFRPVYGDDVVTKVQNAMSYFQYSEQGQERVQRALILKWAREVK